MKYSLLFLLLLISCSEKDIPKEIVQFQKEFKEEVAKKVAEPESTSIKETEEEIDDSLNKKTACLTLSKDMGLSNDYEFNEFLKECEEKSK